MVSPTWSPFWSAFGRRGRALKVQMGKFRPGDFLSLGPVWFAALTSFPRPREHAHDAAHLAERRLFAARAIQWQLRESHAGYQGENPRSPREDGFVFPVSAASNVLKDTVFDLGHSF